MNDKEILVEPTPEEHAYHLGWTGYYMDEELKENPYDLKTETSLFEKWEEGWTFAESVTDSATEA